MKYKHLLKSFVLQHDQSDCGVACLLSLIQYYEGYNTLEKLRELSGTSTQGTTLLGLYQAANKLGFESQGNEADIQAIIDHKNPLILHVVIKERLQHYIVCYSFENGNFTIGDPAKGIITITKEELEKIWKSKTCLTLLPTKNFIKATENQKSKRKWFINLLKDDYQILSLSLIIGAIIALLGMAMAIFSQKLIDDILPSQNWVKLVSGIMLLFFLLLVRVGFTSLREFFTFVFAKAFF